MRLFYKVVFLVSIFILSMSKVYASDSQFNQDLDDLVVDEVNVIEYELIGNQVLSNIDVIASSNDQFSFFTLSLCEDCSLGVEYHVATLGMQYFSQKNLLWKNEVMLSCNATIGSAGCALTSFTMVLSKYIAGFEPDEVNDILGTNACPANWTAYGTTFGITYKNLLGSTPKELEDVRSLLVGVLTQGRAPIIGLLKDVVNGADLTHFVVVSGYTEFSDGSWAFIIKDPAQTTNYPNLGSYIEDSYKIYRIKLFYV